MRALLVLLVAGAAVALVWNQGPGSDPDEPGSNATTAPSDEPDVPLYTPLAAEDFPNGKRIAARIAQRALTYEEGATPRSVAQSLGPSAAGVAALARALEPVVEPKTRSSAKVVYPQLSGVTPTSFGAMVVVRQELENDDGNISSVTRVVDVRLRRSGGPWSLDQIGSFGGEAVPEPGNLSAAAKEVLDNSQIQLPDSARWDIYRGGVDPALLDVLAAAGRARSLSVTVIDSGHPLNVWATSRASAHSTGYAVDIWAVDGAPVIEQRKIGSPAYELAASFAAGGAAQLGAPWALGAGGFTDEVHQDHLHLQQSPQT